MIVIIDTMSPAAPAPVIALYETSAIVQVSWQEYLGLPAENEDVNVRSDASK